MTENQLPYSSHIVQYIFMLSLEVMSPSSNISMLLMLHHSGKMSVTECVLAGGNGDGGNGDGRYGDGCNGDGGSGYGGNGDGDNGDGDKCDGGNGDGGNGDGGPGEGDNGDGGNGDGGNGDGGQIVATGQRGLSAAVQQLQSSYVARFKIM